MIFGRSRKYDVARRREHDVGRNRFTFLLPFDSDDILVKSAVDLFHRYFTACGTRKTGVGDFYHDVIK